jgi:hydroxyethylthiazole kinase-like uncharacterized protein yjeF
MHQSFFRRSRKVIFMSKSNIKYVTQKEAIEIDPTLMNSENGFTVDQLMELAGLSVAEAVYKFYPPTKHPRVLVVCGPGNNGGDGMVASRHLWHFGYKPTILYPKRPDRQLFRNLMLQLGKLDVEFLTELPIGFENDYDQILDAIFGWSFVGQIRSPFDTIIKVCFHPSLIF